MKELKRVRGATWRAVLTLSIAVSMSSGASAWFTAPATSGHAWPAAAHQCFTSSWAAVSPAIGNCGFSGARVWIVPLTVKTSTSARSILVTANNSSAATNHTCKGIKNSGSNAGWFTGAVTWTGSAWSQKTLGSFVIGANETAHVECSFGSYFGGGGSQMSSVQWSG
jgi:hypothetical protein